ncbi:MAG: molybdate ABC transporter substrate-binding protein [Tepidimonas sp.]|uniref:molybdate ABC transporter substrate-binding protein n=1 Tax=Tepidimonas sp. TaxID=2002775 RepID=UPI00259E3943|nr:molybdate ABC transporter substrate-binding protein [Tepidimonas sp.]MDM7456002.1 molybdate ABC transporter substrate-binding protein [Tepidimonas sp.]
MYVRSSRRAILASLALASAAVLGWQRPAQAQSVGAPPTVAAAADLKFAVQEVAELFEQQTGQKLRLVFGSSGNFYAQILQGAPFHLYMSADEDYVLKLADAGKTLDRGRLYAYGRIGIIVPKGSPLKADGELRDLAAALKDGRLRKFAIANPEHAPYGRRAQEALQHAGLWSAIEPKLVYGENIAQTAQFATSGSTDGGIIALSLAKSPQLAALGDFALIPAEWHQPLAQRMVLLKDAPQAAREFYAFLATAPAQAIMTRYGFVMPQTR